MKTPTISLAAARRIAIAAQGLDGTGADSAGKPAPGIRQLTASVQRMGALQIDSVNVLARSHFLPLFARLGRYDRRLLQRASAQRPRRVVESWAHMAAFIPVDTYPALRWRQERAAHEAWQGIRNAEHEHPTLIADVLDAVTELGPITPTQLREELGHSPVLDRTDWGWNWSVIKTVTEFLFFTGQVAVDSRTTQFERRFDLPERVLPADVLAQRLSEPDARRSLVEIAARAHGVASEGCLADYFRQRLAPTRTAIKDLVEAGVLQPVRIPGADGRWYLHHRARRPRSTNANALLSPFDPLVWYRERTQQLFDFHYRIEIYTPPAKRVHGYYVLPFLLGDALAGRADLKADRQAGVLLVQSAWAQPQAPPQTAAALAGQLRQMADWLGLQTVRVTSRGDLAARLTPHLT